jgi:hypothetical protein
MRWQQQWRIDEQQHHNDDPYNEFDDQHDPDFVCSR